MLMYYYSRHCCGKKEKKNENMCLCVQCARLWNFGDDFDRTRVCETPAELGVRAITTSARIGMNRSRLLTR